MTAAEWKEQLPESFRANPAFSYVEDRPGLPRVLLIGDSISISYTQPVQRLLDGTANVHRAPNNCRSTRQTLAELEWYLGQGSWKVIHCNWGIHDVTRKDASGKAVAVDKGPPQVPIEEYASTLERLIDALRATGARLVWATTTPVQPGTHARLNADVLAYNAAALPLMLSRGILVNDLYALAAPRLTELQPPQNIHFTPEGAQVLARQVADHITAALRG